MSGKGDNFKGSELNRTIFQIEGFLRENRLYDDLAVFEKKPYYERNMRGIFCIFRKGPGTLKQYDVNDLRKEIVWKKIESGYTIVYLLDNQDRGVFILRGDSGVFVSSNADIVKRVRDYQCSMIHDYILFKKNPNVDLNQNQNTGGF